MKRIVVIEDTTKKVVFCKNTTELLKLYPQLGVTQNALVQGYGTAGTLQDVIALLDAGDAAIPTYYKVYSYKDELTSHNTSNAEAATAIVVTTDIPEDTPQQGIIKVVKTTTTHTYWYTSWDTRTFTLGTKAVTATTGGTGGTILKIASGSFLDANVRPGMLIVNVTDSSYATVVSVDSATQLTSTALSGGSDDTYTSTDSIIIGALIQAYDNTWSVFTPSQNTVNLGLALVPSDAYVDELITLTDIPKDTAQNSYLLVNDGGTYIRYRYTKALDKKITLDTLKVTAGAGSGATTLIASGFTAGAEVGDMVYNVTDGSHALVTVVDSNTQITTAALTGGLTNTFVSGDTVWVNVAKAAYIGTDRVIIYPWKRDIQALQIITIDDLK